MAKSKGRKKKSNIAVDDNDNSMRWKSPNSGKNKKKNNSKGKSSSSDSGDYSQDDYSFRQKLMNGGEREIIEMKADGNCLFRSISHQLYNDYGQKHDVVRQEICDYLEQNEDDFKVYLLLEDCGENEDVCDFDDYVEQMRNDGEWGGDVEIVCAARLYKRTVTIFSNIGAYNVSIDAEEEKENPNILLSFHDNVHYNSVQDLKKCRTFNAKSTRAVAPDSNDICSNQKTARKKMKKKGSKTQEGNNSFESSDESKNYSNDEMIHNDADLNDRQTNDENTSNQTIVEDDDINTTKCNDSNCKGGKSSKKRSGPKKKESCPCGSGLRYKKCCLAKEKYEIRHGRHGLLKYDGCSQSAKKDKLELEGGFAVLNI